MTDLPPIPAALPVTVNVVDVAVPYATLDDEVHRAAFGRPYEGHDWRFEITWPDGSETCLHAGATADDLALFAVDPLNAHRMEVPGA